MMSKTQKAQRFKVMGLLAKMSHAQRAAFIAGIDKTKEASSSLSTEDERALIKAFLQLEPHERKNLLQAVDTALDEEPQGDLSAVAQ